MRFRCLALSCVLLACVFGERTLAQTPARARTENGRDVLLFPDGTWKYTEDAKAKGSPDGRYQKPPGSTKLFKPTRGDFSVWYDESKWKIAPGQSGESARTKFDMLAGDAYAIVIAEGIAIPLPSLKQIAIDNAKAVAKDVTVVFEEKRVVNGTEALYMRIDGTIQGIPFTYLGYYYGGKQGAIQVITFTGQSLVAKYKGEMENFLNGLEVSP